MRSLILDLRNNPGGLLDEGIAVSDLFLESGGRRSSRRGAGPRAPRTPFEDGAPQRYADLPLVLLVNGYSVLRPRRSWRARCRTTTARS